MKRMKILFLMMLITASSIMQATNFLITGVNDSTKCDNSSLYKTCDGNYYGKTFFSFRPQDSDSSRRILTWFNADYINNPQDACAKNTCTWPQTSRSQNMRFMFAVSPQYTQSFDSNGLAEWFFFNGCDSMTVGIPDANQHFTIDGSQIGLSLGTTNDSYTGTSALTPGSIGTVGARPLVENYIIDLDFWCDLSNWHDNLWMRLEMPIVYMKTNMRMWASGLGKQNEPYPFGLFSLDSMTIDEYGDQICEQTDVPYSSILCALEGNKGWGAVEPLKCGKFSTESLSKSGVAGLHFDLGYDFYDERPWYAAGSLHIVLPTGTRPKGTYVLEPVIGANKSWQLGATLISNYIKEFDHGEFGIYFYAVGTHLFKSRQERVFSLLENGAGSQLLLLKQFNATATELFRAPREANIFCGEAKIGSRLMFDGSLMAQYSYKKLVADIGYNFWVRTKERRSSKVCFREFAQDEFGIKGDTPMKSISTVGGVGAPSICNYNLETNNGATIAGGSSAVDDPAIFIGACSVNYGSALAPTCMSNKIFGAIGYKSSWFALLCGEAEFGVNNAALNQWGIMLKLGVDF